MKPNTCPNTRPNIVAIITARGGSKGLPRKNVLPLGGIPLIAHSILAAKRCSFISECYVTTDDDEIKEVSLSYSAKIIDRPADLASDVAKSADVVEHALTVLKNQNGPNDLGHPAYPAYFVLLQPTSPLRNHHHLNEAFELFFQNNQSDQCNQSNISTCISVTLCDHHPFKTITIDAENKIAPLRDFKDLEMPRQQLPPYYRINGAIYIMSTELFLKEKKFFVMPCRPYIMNERDSIDIDNEWDLRCSELASSRLNHF